jgi:hypothetical protein
VFYPPSPQTRGSKIEKEVGIVELVNKNNEGGMEDKTELDFTASAMGILLLFFYVCGL